MKKHKIDCTCGRSIGLIPEPLRSAGRVWKVAQHRTPEGVRCPDSYLSVPTPVGA